MNILTRINESNEQISILNNSINKLLSPILYEPSALKYGEYISNLGDYVYYKAREIIKTTLEEMDHNFFNMKDRTKRYYSKGYRKREIITIYGHIIFYRHEYMDRSTKKPFIYVDEKIGLHRKNRYDPTVCALIYEKYAHTDSMIEVGKDIGQNLNNPFSIDENRFLNSIPRQTIWKILHRFKTIEFPIIKLDTPNILYIMADEKYIKSQYNNGQSLMVKEFIIHEGVKNIYKTKDLDTGKTYIRNELINPQRIIGYDDSKIFDKVNDYIGETYDINKIKQVYYMGDGGSWIENGQEKIEAYDYKVDYGLDKFHFVLAINAITKDPIYKNLLYDYSFHNMKDDFNKVIGTIINNNPTRKEIIEQKSKYILNHLEAIKTMYKEIKIGCAAEQAISHDLASQFTSIPKAYSPKWLPYYLNLRQNYLNGYDLRKGYLEALDKIKSNTEDNEVSLKEHIDITFFDKQIRKETYTLPKKVLIAIK